MVENAFYMVWRNGGNCPTRRHELIESAREEAKRLAKDNPCQEFFVTRAIEGVIYNENPYRCRNFRKQPEQGMVCSPNSTRRQTPCFIAEKTVCEKEKVY